MRVCSVCGRCYEDQAVSCIEESHPGLSEIRSGGCEMIAGYHLDFSLESGVKGAIYRAHHITSGRSCLINIVSTNTEYRREFLREAQLAAIFFNPNMADVYEAGTLDNGEVFVVAEDPGGQTLREHLNASVPDLLTSIQIVRQVAEALHAIHLKGLMHRALSPENIVLTTDPENGTLVRLQNLDFGGVAQHSIISNKFLIDTALDSLKYFAPEQCSGDAISIRTDVYSLGVVLYEMLAGTTPFEAAKASGLIQAHKTERPPEIKIDDFDLRMLLTHTLMESLAKRPDQRQSSANAFARQMRHIEQLATHVSTPPPAVAFPPTRPRSMAAGSGAPARSIFVEPRVIGREKIKPIAALIPAIKDESEPVAVIEIEIPEILSAEPIADKVVTELGVRRLGLSRLKVRRNKLHRRHHPHPPEEQEIKPPPTEGPTFIEQVRPTEIRVVPPELESILVPVQSHLTKIEWDQPDEDIPTVADMLEVLSQDGIAEIEPEREEITIVVPVEQPMLVRDRAVPNKAAFAFSPTLLGETAERDTRASVLLTLS
ncbi:MAG TPA: serine/threonine-protein kinase, partial [Pyrinomonadaceae bacterium]|nr:serine/threonine-protein kinase [Pyrinomonadaceae bacterium]